MVRFHPDVLCRQRSAYPDCDLIQMSAAANASDTSPVDCGVCTRHFFDNIDSTPETGFCPVCRRERPSRDDQHSISNFGCSVFEADDEDHARFPDGPGKYGLVCNGCGETCELR